MYWNHSPRASAALAFRGGPTLRIIGLEPAHRGRGLGRRLMEALEDAAVRLDAGGISLGADADVVGFYERMGYRGRAVMMRTDLSLPGRALAGRLARRDGG